MNLKKLKKEIVIALTAIMITAPVMGNVNALEKNQINNNNQVELSQEKEKLALYNNDMTLEEKKDAEKERSLFDENTNNSEVFSEEQNKLFKVEFQENYGTDDEFKLISDEDGVKTEVNGAQGIIRITDTNQENNKPVDLRIFDSMDELTQNSVEIKRSAPARPSAWKTQGPDKLNLVVKKGSSRDSLTAYSPKGDKTNYTKPTNSWYTGHTKGYYDEIQDARRSFGTAKEKAGSAARAAFSSTALSYVNALDFNPTIAAFKAAFIAAAKSVAIYDAASAASYGVAYLGHVGLAGSHYRSITY